MEDKTEKKLLVIMAKAPLPGLVKTRLSPELSHEEAARLYQCFLQDRLQEMSKIDGIDIALAYSPDSAEHIFSMLTPKHFDLFPQQNAELGVRLQTIFHEKKMQGYKSVVIIDSDSPDLPKSFVEESFTKMSATPQADVVFGPCSDGGYYLIGMKGVYPELLSGIPWSTENVLRVSLERAEKTGIKTALLSQWHDIDTFPDLVAFYQRYKDQSASPATAGKNTFSYLSGLKKFRAVSQAIMSPQPAGSTD